MTLEASGRSGVRLVSIRRSLLCVDRLQLMTVLYNTSTVDAQLGACLVQANLSYIREWGMDGLLAIVSWRQAGMCFLARLNSHVHLTIEACSSTAARPLSPISPPPIGELQVVSQYHPADSCSLFTTRTQAAFSVTSDKVPSRQRCCECSRQQTDRAFCHGLIP